MKTSSDDLFRLIKALNKPEKGYFKKFASKNASGSRQNYLILFDAIDSMEEYNEEKLKKKLKNEKFLSQLAVYKVYLFNLILKSLNQYGAYENSESKLTELLLNAKILIGKNLYKEAQKILKKAKAIAIQYDKLKFMMEILSMERHIIVQMPHKNALGQREKIYREQKRLYEKIGNFYEYSWLCDQMTILVDNEASYSSDETEKKMEEIISNDWLKDESRPDGYYAKMNFNHTHLVYSGSKNDQQNIFFYLRKGIEHAENNSHFIDENPQNYVYDLINYLLFCNYTGKKDEETRILDKIKAARQKYKNKIPRETEIQIFYHASNVEMILLERSGNMKNGRLKAQQIEKDLARYKNDVPPKLKTVLQSNLACFYFIDGDYEKALKKINTVLNETEPGIRNDVIEFARMFELLIHYEMKNYDLLEYLLHSALKYFRLKVKNFSKRQEKILFSFFSQAIKSTEEMQKPLLEELLFNLKKYADNKQSNPSEFFDYQSWAESKIKNISLADFIKNKNQ